MDKSGSIYLDYQATTPLDPHVLEQMRDYWSLDFGNPHSIDHSYGWSANIAIEKAATEIAQLVGADPDEIVFTSGATEANNLALLGVAKKISRSERNRVLISAVEHKCVIAAAHANKKFLGCGVDVVPVDEQGKIDLEAFRSLLDEDVLIVSCMAINNEIGSIQPLKNVVEMAHRVGALVHVDAAQAFPSMDIDVRAIDIDFLSLSGHKIYGPKGIGALVVTKPNTTNLEPLIYGGGQQAGVRSGTLPVPLCIGLGAAAMLVTQNAKHDRERLRQLRDRLVEGLLALGPEIELIGPALNNRHAGNANVRFLGFSAQDILAMAQPRFAASTGSACTTGVPEASHVLRAIGLSEDDSNQCIRFGVGRTTTEDEVDAAVGMVDEILQDLTDSGLVEGVA